ncbi:MAG: hypothetical protein ACTSV6_00645 [Candidatus Heimdallarchaeota archaeon]
MPGWMRAGYGNPGYGYFSGRGNPFGFCRWFPWMPRWWWTGMYGPVEWTPQGPVLSQQTSAPTQFQPTQFQPQMTQPQMTREQEIQALEQEIKNLEEERKALEQELESLRNRIEELKKQGQ